MPYLAASRSACVSRAPASHLPTMPKPISQTRRQLILRPGALACPDDSSSWFAGAVSAAPPPDGHRRGPRLSTVLHDPGTSADGQPTDIIGSAEGTLAAPGRFSLSVTAAPPD